MMSIQCYGRFISIDGPSEAYDYLRKKGFTVVESEETALGSFRFEAAQEYYNLYQGEDLIARQQPIPLLCEMIISRVHATIAIDCKENTFVRANVVQSPGERAILVAGSTLTGKSRLARSLAAEGGQLWSSFFAVVNDSGELLRYPSAAVPESGLEPAAILNLVYRPDSEWSVQSPSPGQAAMHLLGLVIGGEDGVAKALPRLAAACMKAQVRYQGQRGPAEQALTALAEAQAWPVTA